MSREKRLVGVISIGDVARGTADPSLAGRAVTGASQPKGKHAT
jgi:CBS domain-containing protein